MQRRSGFLRRGRSPERLVYCDVLETEGEAWKLGQLDRSSPCEAMANASEQGIQVQLDDRSPVPPLGEFEGDATTAAP